MSHRLRNEDNKVWTFVVHEMMDDGKASDNRAFGMATRGDDADLCKIPIQAYLGKLVVELG